VRVYRIHGPGAASSPTPTRGAATTARRRRVVFGVVVSVVVIATAAAWWTSPRLLPGRGAIGTEAPRLSIVVLPFTNLSGDPNQDYFADGITEDLTTDLSRLAGSLVISRNTAFTFKGKVVDARQIGRELGVRYRQGRCQIHEFSRRGHAAPRPSLAHARISRIREIIQAFRPG
jgi:adenylate cyclase